MSLRVNTGSDSSDISRLYVQCLTLYKIVVMKHALWNPLMMKRGLLQTSMQSKSSSSTKATRERRVRVEFSHALTNLRYGSLQVLAGVMEEEAE